MKSAFWQKIKQIYLAVYKKIWWLDVLYPFILSALLFSGLTYLVYTGEKHRRLAAYFEEEFIRFSLKLAGTREIIEKNKIITINLTEEDLKKIDFFYKKDYKDVHPRFYAKVIEKLIDLGTSYIVIAWNITEEESQLGIDALKSALKKAQSKGIKIIFAIHQRVKKNIPKPILKYSQIVDQHPCQQGMQMICSYEHQTQGLIIQTIADDFWVKKDITLKNDAITFNLPRRQPSYLLYLNDPSEFLSFSFYHFLNKKIEKNTWESKAVFIGSNLIQGYPGMSKPQDIEKIFTPVFSSEIDVRTTGIPFHVFWAQIAQMFLDDDLIEVTPYQWSLSIAVLFAACIIFLLNIFGLPISLGIFLISLAASPVLNTISILMWRNYLPLFDMIYAGFWSFILLAFGQLSIESFKSWQLNVEQENDRDVMDSKSNFISLISHNLNTPVAKMQGLFELLLKMSKNQNFRKDTHLAYIELSKILLSIRMALILVAIDDENLSEEIMQIQNIPDEFQRIIGNSLKRMNLNIAMKYADEDNDLVHVPFRFDRKCLCTTIGAVILIARNVSKSQDFDVLFKLVEHEDEHHRTTEQFICEVQTDGKIDQKSMIQPLLDKNEISLIDSHSYPIYIHLSINLIKKMIKHYDGHLMIKEDPFAIKISLLPSKEAATDNKP